MTAQDFLSQLKQNLNSIAPDMGTEDGMPVTFILQAVATTLASAEMNVSSASNFFNLAVKTGADLNGFGEFFGIPRWQATPANVILNFYASTPLKSAMTIPPGTIVTDGVHEFQTTQNGVFPQGGTQINVPAQSVNTGADNNVQPYTLTSYVDYINNSNVYVQNEQAATGGTDAETDAHYRQRIKDHLFYRIYGTADSYEHLATTIDDTTRANAVGALETFTEYDELTSLTSANGGGLGFISTIADAQYIYPQSSFLIKNPSGANQKTFVQGVQYTFNTSIYSSAPTIKPVFQIADTSLDTALQNISGEQLDEFGQQMGLPRQLGTPTVGRMTIQIMAPSLESTSIPKGTQFSYTDPSNGDVYNFITTANAVVPPEQQFTGQVPFASITTGNYVLPDNTSLTANNGWSATINSSTAGTAEWTDNEYRSQLEDLYALNEGLNAGDLLYAQFDYIPSCSRNNQEGPWNCLDVFIDGTNAQTVTETGILNLQQITSDNQQYFITEEGNYPAVNSYYQLLGTGNVEQLGGNFYVNGVAYTNVQLIKDYTLEQGSVHAQNAILFNSASNLPNNGDTYQVQLLTNQAVYDTQSKIETIRTMGHDILVHAGIKTSLDINLVVVPLMGTPTQTLINSLTTILSEYLETLPFSADISFSKLKSQIDSSPYVTTCRFANSKDIGTPNIEGGTLSAGITVSSMWGNKLGGTYISDFKLNANQYPVLGTLSIAVEGDNTYRQIYTPTGTNSPAIGMGEQDDPQIYIAQNGNN